MNTQMFTDDSRGDLQNWENLQIKPQGKSELSGRQKEDKGGKRKVGDLGTLGTLRNLQKILSFQENKLNGAKSVKQILGGEGQATPEQSNTVNTSQLPPTHSATLNSHKLHKKQMQLMKSTAGENRLASTGLFNQQKATHRLSTSSLGLQGKSKTSAGQSFGGMKQTDQIQNLLPKEMMGHPPLNILSQTMSGPMQFNAAENVSKPRSKSKTDKVNQIIKQNLKKQKEKTQKEQQDLAIKSEQDQIRKRELQIQNELVRQINKEKIKKQQRKNPLGKDLDLAIPNARNKMKKGMKKSQSTQQHSGFSYNFNRKQQMFNEEQFQNSTKILNMSMLAGENAPNYRRSQERGNQRMLSGSGGKSGSRVLSVAGRSGRSGGTLNQGAGYYLADHSAHAGGKKDSINSNLTQQMNMQQSQQVQGSGFQESQKFDPNVFRAGQHLIDTSDEIIEHSDEDSILKKTMSKKKTIKNKQNEMMDDSGRYLELNNQYQKKLMAQAQSSEDFQIKRSLNSLEEELNQVSYHNTKNISQLLKEEQASENLYDAFEKNKNMRSQKILQGTKMSKNAEQRKRQLTSGSSGAIGLHGNTFGHQQNAHKASNQTMAIQNTTHKLGLDFLDVKKEIRQELKQVDKKTQERYLKRKKTEMTDKDNTMVIFQDSSIQDLRIDQFLNNLQNENNGQINKLRSKSSSPQIRRELKNEGVHMHQQQLKGLTGKSKKNGVNVSTINLQTNNLLSASNHDLLGRLGSQSSLSNLNNLLGYKHDKHGLILNQNQTSRQSLKKNNSAIQKFIKAKKIEYNNKQNQEKQQEISKAIKHRENLSKLDTFVKKKLQQSFNHNHLNSISAGENAFPEFLKDKMTKNKKRKNRSASREKRLRREERLQTEIEKLINCENELDQDFDEEDLADDQKENIFQDLNIFNNKFSGKNKQKAVIDDYKNLDSQLTSFFKKSEKMKKKDNYSFTSARLREFGEQVTDHCDRKQLTPKARKPAHSGTRPNVMKSMNDIIKRSQSQQRSFGQGFPQTSPNLPNRKTVFQVKNKIKTLDITDAHKRKDQFMKKNKQASISHRNPKLLRNGKSQSKMNSNKKKSNSRSRSKSGNKRSKKSNSRSKSNERIGKFSRSVPGSRSPLKSKSNSKSRSRSHSRSNKNQSKKSKKVNKKKFKKSKNSLSPDNELMDMSAAYNKHRVMDPGSSDFNYKKFMHGTIKISPRITKLTQYQRNNKNSKSSNHDPNVRRRRNRSSAKTQNQMQLIGGKQVQAVTGRGTNDSGKPKSQQKAQSLERMGDLSLSQGKNKTIDSRNKHKPPPGPTQTLNMLQKSQKNLILKDIKDNTQSQAQKSKSNKSQVNKEQIQEILKKINYDFNKQKKKKAKKVQQQYIDVTDQSKLQNQSSQEKIEKQHREENTAGKESKNAQENQHSKLQDKNLLHEKNTRVSKSQPDKRSNREQQKQLKELLKQIHIKNEELRIQKEMTENYDLAESLNKRVERPSPGRAEVSSISSSKKNLERFSEKWVDMPNHLQQSHLKQTNRFSELSGQLSQKSQNNFTFFEKQSSMKDFKQRSSDLKLSSQMQNTFGMINSSGGDQQIIQQHRQDQNLNKLQKLYLNNLDMENSSSHSLKLNEMNVPKPVGVQKLNKSRENSNQYAQKQGQFDHSNQLMANGPISNRSGRSAHSGIMAQINGLANAGHVLRADNELFYPHLLNNQNQPPFTAIDSHRSNASQKTYNMNLLNQELMIIGSGAIGSSQGGPAADNNQMAFVQNRAQYDDVTQNQPKNAKWNMKEKFLTADGKSPSDSLNQKGAYKAAEKQTSQIESGSSKYVQNFQSNDNKLSSQMNIDRLKRFDNQVDDSAGKQEIEEVQFRGKQKKNNTAAPAMSKKKIDKGSPEQKVQNFPNESEEDDSNNSHSQTSLKISQINIDKTIESRSIPLSGERISNDDENKNLQSQSQNSYERNYQLQSNSMPYSLISHKSQSHRSEEQSENSKRDRESAKQKQIDQKIMNEMENGPHTLISHLNDPNNEIQMNDEIDDVDPKVKLTQQISPLDTNLIPDDDAVQDKNTPAISSAQNSEKQQTAENLLKYLDHKYKEKKQENSSQFDHSRASMQSDQLLSKRRQYEGQNSEGRASRYLVDKPIPGESSHSQKNHSNAEPIETNAEFCFEPLDVNDIQFNLKEAADEAEEPAASPPLEDRSVDEIDKSLSAQPKLNNPKTTPNQEATPIDSPKQVTFNRQRAEELEDYLDTNIDKENVSSSKKNDMKTTIEMNIEDYEQDIHQDGQSPKLPAQDQQAAASSEPVPPSINAEMIITSNLTTLNLDGGDSSSDGPGPTHQLNYKDVNRHSIDSGDEEGQKMLNDQKYLEQFRKRQNRISEEKKIRDRDAENIEIEIQENSPQLSEKNLSQQDSGKKEHEVNPNPMSIEMNTSPEPSPGEDLDEDTLVSAVLASKQPGGNINISDLLKNQDKPLQKPEPYNFCSKIIAEILQSIPKKEISVEEYHEQLFQTLIKKSDEPKEQVKDTKEKEVSFAKKSKNLAPQDIYHFISSSINQSELKHQIKQVIEMKQRQYVENDLIRSDDYINELLQYLLQFEMLTQQQLSVMDGSASQYFGPGHEALLQELGGINYLIIFLKNLTNPIKKNLNDILLQLQKQEHGSYAHFESVQDPLRHPIIPIDVYLDVEKQREFEYQLTQQQIAMHSAGGSSNPAKGYLTGQSGNTQNTASILQESQHILNKSIFDAMNESLTKFRPYGIVGEPLPWSNKYRRLQTEVDINSVDTERLIQMVKQEVFRWMSTQQGALLHGHDTIFQYIDLQVPYMPEIQEKMAEESLSGKKIEADIDSPVLSPSIKDEDKEEEKEEETTDKKKIESEEKSPPPMPLLDDKDGNKNKKEEKSNKDQEPDKKAEPARTAKELQKVQDQQFEKFKKTLIDDATQELRQSKLANQLQQEILEDEHFWLNYEFEETQIRIDLGDMILQTLLEETVDFLKSKDGSPGPEIEELKF